MFARLVDRYKGVLINLDAKCFFGSIYASLSDLEASWSLLDCVLGRIYASLSDLEATWSLLDALRTLLDASKHPWSVLDAFEASWTHLKRPGDSSDAFEASWTDWTHLKRPWASKSVQVIDWMLQGDWMDAFRWLIGYIGLLQTLIKVIKVNEGNQSRWLASNQDRCKH